MIIVVRMVVEYDERSAFKEDIYTTNYTPKSKSKSNKRGGGYYNINNQYGFSRKHRVKRCILNNNNNNNNNIFPLN